MGSVAMRMLIKMLNNKPLEQDQFVLDYKLIKEKVLNKKEPFIDLFLFDCI